MEISHYSSAKYQILINSAFHQNAFCKISNNPSQQVSFSQQNQLFLLNTKKRYAQRQDHLLRMAIQHSIAWSDKWLRSIRT